MAFSRLLCCCLALAITLKPIAAQIATTSFFVVPPDLGANMVFGTNDVYNIGQTVDVEWVTDKQTYSMVLWQQSLTVASALNGQPVYSKVAGSPETGTFRWTADAQTFDLNQSNVFFFSCGPVSNTIDANSFTSHYFNLTDGNLATTSNSSGASGTSPSSSTQSTTSTPLILPTPNPALNATSSSPPTSSPPTEAQTQSNPNTISKLSLGLGLGLGLGIGIPLLLVTVYLLITRSRSKSRSPNHAHSHSHSRTHKPSDSNSDIAGLVNEHEKPPPPFEKPPRYAAEMAVAQKVGWLAGTTTTNYKSYGDGRDRNGYARTVGVVELPVDGGSLGK